MWHQLDATISDFIVNQLFLNMFRASLRPSSGGHTAFSLLMVIYPVVMLGESAGKLCALSNITTGHITICSENAVWPPEDRRKDARNMLRNNWLTIKSLIVGSTWSHIYLLGGRYFIGPCLACTDIHCFVTGWITVLDLPLNT